MNDNCITEIDIRINEMNNLNALELRNNQITHIPNIEHLSQLKVLNLSHNNIHSLDPSIFFLPLVELHLNDNKIVNIPNDIGFLACIMKLDLSNNQLLSVPDGLTKLITLTNLNLSNNNISTISLSTFEEMDVLTELTLSNNRITSITNNPFKKSLQSLTIMDLKYNQLKKLDLNFFAPKLRELTSSFNKIVEISGLVNFPLLEVLDVRDNDLVTLSNEVLSLKHLRRLDICNNNISSLQPEIGLLDLSVFLFSGNPLRGIPSSNSTIRILEILRNRIPEVEVVKNVIHENVVSGHKSSLDLTNKNLHSYSAIFQNIIGSYTSLDATRNSLTCIPDSLYLSGLVTLDISRNKIETLKFKGDLPNLDQLIVNFNRLTSLDFDEIRPGFPNISVLCASNNQITFLNAIILKTAFLKLKVLDLSNNELMIVPPKLGLIELSLLKICGNPFRIPRADVLHKSICVFILDTAGILEYLKGRIVD
jgi:Leucine-rich repeat (LRR) protein